MVAVVAAYFLLSGNSLVPANSENVPTAVAKITTLVDKVVEQGDLESQSTIVGKCEIDHYENTLIFLAPEGTVVKKGDVVAKFDSSEYAKFLSQQEKEVNEQKAELETAKQELAVQLDANKIDLRKAKQTLDFAKLALNKYEEGDFKVQLSELEGTISEAKTAVDKASRDRDNIRVLVKKGFREYEQLREADQVVKSTEIRLKNSKQRMETLLKFDHPKQLTELKDKLEEAKYGLKIAETTASAKEAKARDRLINEENGLEIRKRRLERIQKGLKMHTMEAPQDGTLTYALNRWTGMGEKVREGIRIHQNQEVFVLPDMGRMQVKVGIHETMVSKIKPGQRAIIRIDAFSGSSLRGEVKSVSALSASTPWERSKNYTVIVTIDSFPEEMKIRPGMGAEVEVKVGEYSDVLAIPIQAVTSFGRRKYVFMQDGNGEFVPVKVETGRSNLSFVEITDGMTDGAVVALDAYQRGLNEFSDRDAEEEEVLDEGAIDGEAIVDAPPAAGTTNAPAKRIEIQVDDENETTQSADQKSGENNDSENKDSEATKDSNVDASKDESTSSAAESTEAAESKAAESKPTESEATTGDTGDEEPNKAETSTGEVDDDQSNIDDDELEGQSASEEETPETETKSIEGATPPASNGSLPKPAKAVDNDTTTVQEK
ncbi:MAG: HlyD family efflux transporter periplasmic adaptor subunit [Planctomycetota bacterium]